MTSADKKLLNGSPTGIDDDSPAGGTALHLPPTKRTWFTDVCLLLRVVSAAYGMVGSTDESLHNKP